MSGIDEQGHSQGEGANNDISQLPAETLTASPAALRPVASDFLDVVPNQSIGSEKEKAGDEGMEKGTKMENGSNGLDEDREGESSEEVKEDRVVKLEAAMVPYEDLNPVSGSCSYLFLDGEDSGDEDEQAAFMQELERFHIEHNLEYKPPKFYGKALNCLKYVLI
jgi:hypothetical protein